MNQKNPLQPIHRHQEELLALLMKELQQNPHFADSNLKSNENTERLSKSFLNNIVSTVSKHDLSKLAVAPIEPLLSLWHTIIKELMSGGFSTKDTAMLIYALKTSFQTIKDSIHSPDVSTDFEQILDALGMLTFEMYTVENERLLTRKNEQITYLQEQKPSFTSKIIGSSPAMSGVYKAMGLILENDLTVLLEGESGTGKDLIASTIHVNSKRSKKPFIAINCGAIPKDLIESELFGHEKGAFTGAGDKRIGKFELADGGTLFLDEIGELPLDLQVKLLRVLQNKQIERIGSEKHINLDVRIIAATNQALKQRVDEKQFRLDLYYRLNVFPITVPPLRERIEDIEALTHYFMEKTATEFNIPVPTISNQAISFLQQQPWEGNIRELENVIQRSIVLAQGNPITPDILTLIPGQFQTSIEGTMKKLLPAAPASQTGVVRPLDDVEKEAIEHAIHAKKGNMLQVAKALHISRTTLYAKIKKYQIHVD